MFSNCEPKNRLTVFPVKKFPARFSCSDILCNFKWKSECETILKLHANFVCARERSSRLLLENRNRNEDEGRQQKKIHKRLIKKWKLLNLKILYGIWNIFYISFLIAEKWVTTPLKSQNSYLSLKQSSWEVEHLSNNISRFDKRGSRNFFLHITFKYI